MANNQHQITISKDQMIDLVNSIGQRDMYYNAYSCNNAYQRVKSYCPSTSFILYTLQSIFENDDRNYFPLFPYDDFNQWFSTVGMQVFTAWFDNHFSKDLSSFNRLGELTFFMIIVKNELEDLRDKLIEKRNNEIKLIDDACSISGLAV
ncbi:hypothetical protein [Bartonella sp. cb54]|uniref:hypothetical protein n=1 Tax=Bartonella sp. cb54 TaxID=3385560 RepID=UPI0039A57F91